VVTLDVAADTTLSELAALINDDADNPGVTASVIDDGSGSSSYKLLIQADDTGEDNRISVTTQLDDLAMSEETGAGGASLNSQVTIDGISYQRQGNTISDVLTGVTMTLAATGSATLTVSGSEDDVKSLIEDMVSAYNAATQEIRDNTAYDESTGQFGILAGTSLRDLAFDLQDLMTSTVQADSSGTVTTLFDLGLEFDRDGTITIDQQALDSAVSNHFDQVKAFFLGDDDNGITGLADLVNDRLRTMTGGSGQIEGEKTATNELIADLEDQIERISDRIDRRYDILSKQFVELDRYMSQMTALSDYLTSQFDSITNPGGSSGGK
jgi:flagellar hook-associated protein 2